jgi:DNA-directed RNA polymerase specialized sigma24 family protein
MAGHLDTRLYDTFLAAATDRDKIKVFKDQARQHPTEAAAAVRSGVPLMIQHKREQAHALYNVDLADQEWTQQAKRRNLSLVDGVLLLMSANTYLALTVCQAKLDAYDKDAHLSRENWAKKVCQAGIECLEATEAILLHALTEIPSWTQSVGGSGEVEVAKDAAALRLAGHLATRTSPTINKRLAKALDAIRNYNKPSGRARLEALLGELYVEAPEVWRKYAQTDWQLRATRSEAAKNIEQRHKPQAVEIDLAAFAEREALLIEQRDKPQAVEFELPTPATREALLKRGREAGLPPREYELFALVMGDPERFLRNGKLNHREAAQEMDVAVGTIKSLWSRIKKTLAA